MAIAKLSWIVVALAACGAHSAKSPKIHNEVARRCHGSAGPNGGHIDANQVPITITSGIEFSQRSAVAAIAPYPEAAGWFSLIMEGTTDAAQRTLPIYMPGQPVVRVGDIVEVRNRREPVGGVAYDDATELLDAKGLLLAASFTGMASLADWEIEPSAGPASDVCTYRLRHAGADVVASGNEWRRFIASDGVFAVSLQCPRPNLPDTAPVPDDWAPDPLVIRVVRLARSAPQDDCATTSR
jgi:hypothetical protein